MMKSYPCVIEEFIEVQVSHCGDRRKNKFCCGKTDTLTMSGNSVRIALRRHLPSLN